MYCCVNNVLLYLLNMKIEYNMIIYTIIITLCFLMLWLSCALILPFKQIKFSVKYVVRIPSVHVTGILR